MMQALEAASPTEGRLLRLGVWVECGVRHSPDPSIISQSARARQDPRIHAASTLARATTAAGIRPPTSATLLPRSSRRYEPILAVPCTRAAAESRANDYPILAL